MKLLEADWIAKTESLNFDNEMSTISSSLLHKYRIVDHQSEATSEQEGTSLLLSSLHTQPKVEAKVNQ